jgi:hypothetical protein
LAQKQRVWYGDDTAWTDFSMPTLLVLTGCMVGPKYTKPDVPTAPTFKETEQRQDGDGWKVAEPSDTALRRKWWELYCDARLNELEEQVDPSNQTVKEAEANFRQARAAVRFNRAAQAPTIAVAPSAAGVSLFRKRALFPLLSGEQRYWRSHASCRLVLRGGPLGTHSPYWQSFERTGPGQCRRAGDGSVEPSCRGRDRLLRSARR